MSDVHFHAMGPGRARTGEDPLVPFLRSARGGQVTITARDVHRLDAHRLQVLLVARQQWIVDGVPFKVTDMSDSFRAGLERLGIDADHFDKEPVQ